MRFGKPYQHVQTVSTGPAVDWDPAEIFNDESKELTSKNPALFMSQVMDIMFTNYERGKII
jgi:hypothetical protein